MEDSSIVDGLGKEKFPNGTLELHKHCPTVKRAGLARTNITTSDVPGTAKSRRPPRAAGPSVVCEWSSHYSSPQHFYTVGLPETTNARTSICPQECGIGALVTEVPKTVSLFAKPPAPKRPQPGMGSVIGTSQADLEISTQAGSANPDMPQISGLNIQLCLVPAGAWVPLQSWRCRTIGICIGNVLEANHPWDEKKKTRHMQKHWRLQHQLIKYKLKKCNDDQDDFWFF